MSKTRKVIWIALTVILLVILGRVWEPLVFRPAWRMIYGTSVTWNGMTIDVGNDFFYRMHEGEVLIGKFGAGAGPLPSETYMTFSTWSPGDNSFADWVGRLCGGGAGGGCQLITETVGGNRMDCVASQMRTDTTADREFFSLCTVAGADVMVEYGGTEELHSEFHQIATAALGTLGSSATE